MHTDEIEVKLQSLPDSARREALDYIEFLLQKYKNTQKTSAPLHFDWENALKNISEEVSSVELQHRASEWR